MVLYPKPEESRRVISLCNSKSIGTEIDGDIGPFFSEIDYISNECGTLAYAELHEDHTVCNGRKEHEIFDRRRVGRGELTSHIV